jgi:hypothetical protein
MQTGMARNTPKKCVAAFAASGFTFEQINVLSDKDLEEMFIKPEDKPLSEKLQSLFSLFPAIDKALKKKEVARIERQQLLILDDFGLQPLDGPSRTALMELVEDRHGKSALIITSQVPVSKWYDIIGEQTIADAILDRIVHNAHRLELKGESLRSTSFPRRSTQCESRSHLSGQSFPQ